MKKITFVGCAAVLLLASSTAVMAGSRGASQFASGTLFRAQGPVTGAPGASGYAPGHMFQDNGPVPGAPGASGYAPGVHVRH